MSLKDYTQSFFEAPNLDGSGTHRLGCLEWGEEGNPPLICVHGLTRNAHDFDYLADTLSKRFHIFCLDMAGRGSSDWLENKLLYHYGTYVADCLAFLQHKQLEKVHWLGTSMGGIIAMMLAASTPGKLASLVLNDIGSLVPKEGLERITRYAGTRRQFEHYEEAVAFLAEITEPFAIHNPEHWRHFADKSLWKMDDGSYILACDPEIMVPFREETDDFTHITDIDLQPFWDAVDCPVLLLRGEETDLLRGETVRQMAATQGKEVTLIEFPGVGHAPALMEDEQIGKVKSWLLWQR